ncbi:MAG: hypothetical protein ACE5JK_03945, partial [Candidatus Omnitrophota bacterium]
MITHLSFVKIVYGYKPYNIFRKLRKEFFGFFLVFWHKFFIVFLELFFSRWVVICGIFFSATFWSYLTLARAPDTFEGTAQILIR